MIVLNMREAWPTTTRTTAHPNHKKLSEYAYHIGTYALVHAPTRATYYGSTSNIQADFVAWYNRLLHIDTQPMLSLRFRYFYTRREDFRYCILRAQSRSDGWPAELDAMSQQVDAMIDKKRKTDNMRLLNSDNTTKEQMEWLDRLPIDKRRAFTPEGKLTRCKWSLDNHITT